MLVNPGIQIWVTLSPLVHIGTIRRVKGNLRGEFSWDKIESEVISWILDQTGAYPVDKGNIFVMLHFIWNRFVTKKASLNSISIVSCVGQHLVHMPKENMKATDLWIVNIGSARTAFSPLENI